MAFKQQGPLFSKQRDLYLEPASGKFGQAFSTWRAVRSNKTELLPVLPGIVEAHRFPWNTAKRLRNLQTREDGEGYVIRRNGVASGIATLLSKTPKGQSEGVQLDYWLDIDAPRRMAPEIARLLLQRAWNIIDMENLPGSPHAWLDREIAKDPSSGLAYVMQPSEQQVGYTEDVDSNAPVEHSYVLYVAKKAA